MSLHTEEEDFVAKTIVSLAEGVRGDGTPGRAWDREQTMGLREAWEILCHEFRLGRGIASPASLARSVVTISSSTNSAETPAYLKREQDFEVLFGQVLQGKRSCPQVALEAVCRVVGEKTREAGLFERTVEAENTARMLLQGGMISSSSCRSLTSDLQMMRSCLKEAWRITGAVPMDVFSTDFGAYILRTIIHRLARASRAQEESNLGLGELIEVRVGLSSHQDATVWKRKIDGFLEEHRLSTAQLARLEMRLKVAVDEEFQPLENTVVFESPATTQGFFVDMAIGKAVFTMSSRSESSTKSWLASFEKRFQASAAV